jgi:hypothetical protein
MSAKKMPYISDRVTARKAKVYIYGLKEKRKLEAVTATNRNATFAQNKGDYRNYECKINI